MSAAAAARFFATPAEWRRWLATHHATADELWVGFHKRATGKPSLTWPEAVDGALCTVRRPRSERQDAAVQ